MTNRMRQHCALVLVLALILSIFANSSVGLVWAQDSAQECTECGQTGTHLETCSLYTAETPDDPAVPTETTAPGEPEVTFCERLLACEDAEAMYGLILSDMQSNGSAELKALTAEELNRVTEKANGFPEDPEGATTKTDLLNTLAALSGEDITGDAQVLAPNGSITIDNTTYTITDVSTLVDADLALLRWQAMGSDAAGTVSGIFDGVTYAGYTAVYEKIYEQLLANATDGLVFSDGADLPVQKTYTNGTRIIKLKDNAKVNLSNWIEVYYTGRVIIVAESSATIVLGSSNGGRFTMGWQNEYQKNDSCCFSIQGKSTENSITITGDGGTRNQTPCFRLCGGSLYLNNTIITDFIFSSSEVGDAVIYGPHGYNAKRCLYMTNSTMQNISGGKSPGIFLRAYHDTTNDQNALSELNLYNNTFNNCNTTGNSTYAGGPVIRSFAADSCNLRIEKCSFTNNTCNSSNTASGGGAIYWKSAAGKAELIDCTFSKNSSNGIGGAIFNTGNMTIKNCRFIENSAKQGGGAIAAEPPRTSSNFPNIDTNNLSGSLTLDAETVIKENHTTNNGGALFFNALVGDNGTKISQYKMKINVEGATIEKNTADGNGGAIAMLLNYGSYNYETGIYISSGLISNNVSAKNGGAIWMSSSTDCSCNNNDGVALSGGQIQDNSASNGGAIYIETGMPDVSMAFNMSGGTFSGNTASENGGAAYIKGGNFVITGGKLGEEEKPNSAVLGGGVYVAGGTVSVGGGLVQYNTADNGAGVYINGGAMNMSAGTFSENTASQNGGAAYITGGDFTMTGGKLGEEGKPNSAKLGGGVYLTGGEVEISDTGTVEGNSATHGGGVYLTGGTFTLDGQNAAIVKNNATNGGGVYLDRINPSLFSGKIADNTATENGGGIYIDRNAVTLVPSGTVTISGNEAENGAGMYIGGEQNTPASFSMDATAAGTISFTGNTASGEGGAVCISNGTYNQNSDKITISGNRATSGGGISVLSGDAVISAGEVKNNTANKGGAIHVHGGNYRMEDGRIAGNTASESGGGIYVDDGNVEIIYGEITENTANINGGGIFVSANHSPVSVIMLSGSLSNNTATKNGGGMAVDSSTSQKITVKIGCLLNHDNKPASETNQIDYTGEYAKYNSHTHKSCPIVSGNKAGSIGGGFYLNSTDSSLCFYCVLEENNTASGNTSCWGMDVEGGDVSIGDSKYHNHNVTTTGNPRGYVAMKSSVLVNGGNVNLYGDMTNPYFAEAVTVDIQANRGSFTDHRRGDDYYKVHYFENFDDTGIYIALQYKVSEIKENGSTRDACQIIIQPAMFSNPGYEIEGWYTLSSYNAAAPVDGHMFFTVGQPYDLAQLAAAKPPYIGIHPTNCKICGEESKDQYLLKLYAIWKANGYKVIFDPNLPAGVTEYEGKMEPQIMTYDTEANLRPNTYAIPGYIFLGWSKSATGNKVDYTDNKLVKNMTEEQGVEIILYAVWEKCDHSGAQHYTAESNSLHRECTVCGKTWTATIYAEDTVYDGQPHEAKLLGEETEWAGSISYSIAPLTYDPAEDVVDNNYQPGLVGDKPVNAATYTAKITAGGQAASLTYTIARAEQSKPGIPTYTESKTEGGQVTALIINKLDGNSGISPETKKEARYRLSYYENSTLRSTEWKSIGSGDPGITIELNYAWTNYFVEAKFPGTENYLPSEETRAASTYYFTGNVRVEVVCDPDITYKLEAAQADGNNDGLMLTLSHDIQKYYLVGGAYTVTHKTIVSGAEQPATIAQNGNVFSFTAIPAGCTLKITIGDARPIPTLQMCAVENQVFTEISGVSSVQISKDSAFTSAVTITNFDPEVYSTPSLNFSNALPEGATIIMLDRSNSSYWYYKATGETKAASVLDFQKMGSSDTADKYKLPENKEHFDLNLQFIVDASNSSGYTTAFTVSVGLTPLKEETQARNDLKSISVKTCVPAFTMAADSATGAARTITYGFTSEYAASRWDNRGSALVLTPSASDTLPVDAYLSVTVNKVRSSIYRQSNGTFIIPLGALCENGNVELELRSAYFQKSKQYTFTVSWLVSGSAESSAPYPGTEVGSLDQLTFNVGQASRPSVKITGTKRVLTTSEPISLKVELRNTNGYTIEAALLRESETGMYVGTAWKKKIVASDDLAIPLASYSSGNYCVALTLTKENDTTILDVIRYYFVIE